MREEHEPNPVRRGRWGVRARALLCGLGFSLLMSLAFPPVGWWWTAPLAVTPLIFASRLRAASPRALGFWAGLGTSIFWAQTHLWIWTEDVSPLGLVFLVPLLSLYPGLFVWLGARLERRGRISAWVWGAPVLWGGIEAVRALVAFDGYPWFLVGHPLIDAPRWGNGAPSLAWPASYIGAMGVSALAVGVSGLVVDVWTRRPRRWIIAGLVVVGAWVGLGVWGAPSAGDGGSMRVGVVQTNVSQDNKIGWRPVDQLRDFQRFAELTVAAARRGPDLIVWPETMAPGQSLDPVSLKTEQEEALAWEIELEGEGMVELGTTELVEQLLSLQEMLGVPMLIGAEGYDNLRFVERADGKFVKDADAFYNSAYIVTGGRAQEPGYHKIKLTPFGEVMPYISLWPWLEAQVTAVGARGMSFDLSTAPRVVRPDTTLRDGRRVSLATPICFEATMSGVCRRLTFERGERRAGVMINLTNDGWFGDGVSGRRSHQLCARWRCVELVTPMVRVANTGISCVIDPGGRVVREGVDPVPSESGEHATGGLERVDGVLVADVTLAAGVPVYARIGDLASWGLIAGVGACLVLGLRGGSQSGGAGSAEDEGRTDAPARSNQ